MRRRASSSATSCRHRNRIALPTFGNANRFGEGPRFARASGAFCLPAISAGVPRFELKGGFLPALQFIGARTVFFPSARRMRAPRCILLRKPAASLNSDFLCVPIHSGSIPGATGTDASQQCVDFVIEREMADRGANEADAIGHGLASPTSRCGRQEAADRRTDCASEAPIAPGVNTRNTDPNSPERT